MAKKEDARYGYSVTEILLRPLNEDGTQPVYNNLIGGVGPFDLSGSSDPTGASIPFTTKIDSTAAENDTINVTAAVDLTAVTVAEMVTAINTSAPTAVTASAEAVTGRIKIVFGSPAVAGSNVQFYGELAEILLLGQGFGQRIIYSNTMQSFSDDPISKDEETFTITDANGIDTEVVTDGYKKGLSGVLTETAQDYLTRALIEGGTYDETALTYDDPTSNSSKIYFKIEVYSSIYRFGTNKVGDLVGYVKQEIFSCKGNFGGRTRERGILTSTYNYTATSPRDSSGNITTASTETQLTTAVYDALLLSTIAV